MGQTSSKQGDTTVSRPLGDINLQPRPGGVSRFVSSTVTSAAALRPQHYRVETPRYREGWPPSRPPPQPDPKPQPQTQLQPMPQPPATTKPEHPQAAWKLWRNLYSKSGVSQENLDIYDNRLERNAESAWKQKEKEIEQLRLKRARAEAALYTEKESPRPALTLPSCLNLASRFKAFKTYDENYFARKPERPPLTPEMQALVKNASIPSPATEVLVQIDGVDIARKDIRTLTGLNWLNDEIINAYMYLIVQRGREPTKKKVYAFNTFFYPKVRESGYASVKRWTRKVDIFSHDYLLVPVHLGNHWCLAFINFNARRIEYYDSLGGGPNGCCDTLLEYLRYEMNDKKKQEFDAENWQLINSYSDTGIPQQLNCSDCGVFACIYAEYLTRQAKLSFTQEHMQYFRDKMIYELMTKRLLE